MSAAPPVEPCTTVLEAQRADSGSVRQGRERPMKNSPDFKLILLFLRVIMKTQSNMNRCMDKMSAD